MADLLASGAGLAAASPWGAALGALGSALGTTPSSNATTGSTTAGPVSISIAGFGGKSSSSATQSTDPGEARFAPSLPGFSQGVNWVLPAVIVAGAVLLAVLLRR